jgi:holo-[acyl-carrier protein] synthase
MAIIGIGIDATEIVRMQAALEDPTTGARFKARVFTAGEQGYCDGRGVGRWQSYAARFAAKEAAMKALGLGWGGRIGWLDIEVTRAEEGRPTIGLHGKGRVAAAAAGVDRLHLALTHTRDVAIAQVTAEGIPER